MKTLYLDTFEKNLFTSMERVCKIWDDELTSILDIEKIGHRKRILLSVAGKHDIANRFGKVIILLLYNILFLILRQNNYVRLLYEY